MNDTKTPSKTLSLKRPVEAGVVRQSFSHGRTKTVVVEKVKRRAIGPADHAAREPAPAPAPPTAAPASAPAPAAVAPRPQRSPRRAGPVPPAARRSARRAPLRLSRPLRLLWRGRPRLSCSRTRRRSPSRRRRLLQRRSPAPAPVRPAVVPPPQPVGAVRRPLPDGRSAPCRRRPQWRRAAPPRRARRPARRAASCSAP